MKYVSNKSGTRSFLKVLILINLGIVKFLISENRGTFEVSVHRATLPEMQQETGKFAILFR